MPKDLTIRDAERELRRVAAEQQHIATSVRATQRDRDRIAADARAAERQLQRAKDGR